MVLGKKAQVWIETVIYTLIILTLIGVVLAISIPVIEKQKDKAIIQNSVNSLNEFDSTILNIKRAGISNVREINLNIGEGKFKVDGVNDKLIFEILKSSYAYSEPGITVNLVGTNMKSETKKNGGKYDVKLTLSYNNTANITINDLDELKEYSPAPIPYVFFIEHRGKIPVEGNSCIDDGACSRRSSCISNKCLCTTDSNCNPGFSCINTQCVPNLPTINIYEG